MKSRLEIHYKTTTLPSSLVTIQVKIFGAVDPNAQARWCPCLQHDWLWNAIFGVHVLKANCWSYPMLARTYWRKWSLNVLYLMKRLICALRSCVSACFSPINLPELGRKTFNQGYYWPTSSHWQVFHCVLAMQLFHQERETKCSLCIIFIVCFPL